MIDKQNIAPPQKRLVLVISSMQGGGAERVMALLAGEWTRRGYPVTLITLDDAPDVYALPAEVRRIRLGLTGNSTGRLDALRRNWERLRGLNRAILAENPLAVISFMDRTNVLTLLALRRVPFPVIVSERIDPRHYPMGRGWEVLRQKLYPRASAVVLQTHAVAQWAATFLPARKIHVLPNPVVVPEDIGAAEASPEGLPPGPYLVAMGRLDRQKGFDLLLKAFAAITAKFPDHHLVILGEGSERLALEALREQLQLGRRVHLPGRMAEAWPILRRAEAFVMSSRFEGFPNALLEAMALGLPVISYNCPSGPGEILSDGQTGLLVKPEDVPGLAQAMERLLSAPGLRQQLGLAAREATRAYDVATIAGSWERLFTSA